jgi:hypothetical protein
MKNENKAQKLNREAQKTIMGQASSVCPPTGCHRYSIKDGNDICIVLPCHSVHGTVRLVDGEYQCCF